MVVQIFVLRPTLQNCKMTLQLKLKEIADCVVDGPHCLLPRSSSSGKALVDPHVRGRKLHTHTQPGQPRCITKRLCVILQLHRKQDAFVKERNMLCICCRASSV